jgi:cytochrome c biogenesis protein CcmG/thiol:disulfide interchange protein DsbE
VLPFALFAALMTVFAVQLLRGGSNNDIPSALIDKPAPQFALPPLDGMKRVDGEQLPGLTTADLRTGKVHVVNVWASWCGPCRLEHPLLMELAADRRVELAGINYKDQPPNAVRFLGQLGNPFVRIGADEKGKSTIDWGVYGVPETFIVDARGIVVLKHVGPITAVSLHDRILPAIDQAIARSGQ